MTDRFNCSVFLGCAVRRTLTADSDSAESLLDALKANEDFLQPSHLALLAKEAADACSLTEAERLNREKAAPILGPWLEAAAKRRAGSPGPAGEQGECPDETVFLKGDIDLIALLAFRYALPRHTSVTSIAPEVILGHRHLLKPGTLAHMADEAEAFLKTRTGGYGAIDDRNWAGFAEDVRTKGAVPFKPC